MKQTARRLARWLLLSPALFALACALLAPAEAGRAPAPPRAAQEEPRARRRMEPPADSTVRGRVVYDETSRPVRRARVILSSEGAMRGERSALTDARGEFVIRGVRAGTYLAFVDVPGVLSPVAFIGLVELHGGGPSMPDLGEGRAFFDVFEVDGEEDVAVTVHARRGASVGGRVTYADGDPAVNCTVNLLRRDAAGRPQRILNGANLVSISGLRTDDRGMFRVTGLPPGEYVVGVSEPAEHSPSGGRARSDDVPGMVEGLLSQQFLMTFHPSATSAKEAAVVRLAAGEERADVDVRIPERELRAVSGVVRSRRDKRPLPGARVYIARRDDPLGAAAASVAYDAGEPAGHATTTDEEGRWQFREIPDGPYTVTVRPADEYDQPAVVGHTNANNTNVAAADHAGPGGNMNGPWRPPRRKRGHAPTQRDVEVSGGDLSEVFIEPGEGGRVAGTVRADGEGPPPYASVGVLRLNGGVVGPAEVREMRGAEASGGQFTIDGLPAGRFLFQATGYDTGSTLYVKSITWNGKDYTREPLELAEGATAEGVEIVFARNPASLRVTAVRAGGREPALQAVVVLVPADSADWSPYMPGGLSCPRADDGVCSLSAPPGEYRVVALPRRPALDAVAAEVRRRAASAPRIVLRAGEKRELEVVVPDK